MEQVIDAGPVFFGDAALLGFCVAYFHCLGTEVGVFGEAFWREIINGGDGFGEGL